MASNPATNWPPYDSYRDCSQGICSIYCPQWCYIIFPPPPPFYNGDDSDSTTPNFSPLIIAVIGILGSAFLLVSYYTIISKYCKKASNTDQDQNSSNALEIQPTQINDGQMQPSQQVGLNESLIKSIAVCKYKKSDGLIDGVDCAVCLSEFQENESLRLLPKCSHAFHLPCIDTWLRSHPNCPLCRANVISLTPLPLQSNSSTHYNVSSLQVTMQNDLVLVVDNPDIIHRNEVFDAGGNSSNQENELQENLQEITRSYSRESQRCQNHPMISDILDIREYEEDLSREIIESHVGNYPVSKQECC